MSSSDVDPARGVYGISVAADLVGMDPQSLRLYERRGLLEPARTGGGTRRYSSDDLARLQRIGYLLAAGLNLAGIARVLELETENAQLRADLERTQATDMAPAPQPAPVEARAETGRPRPKHRPAR
ncbi:MerR HTH family regulatory protein [Parafrankia irregularis]|uniref:MerR HTH family regulatory protein n=1 Tax=Parafrankia irregularis TaxID=795642 RepID=A0A0S4QW27_9ACTN|nr:MULTISPECIES: helix-turn-helix transcriptional regulator [Parafrankia]MBE3204854.1 helix-turn-helix transcriptional regulator [Parafrankia sp. CH37]CUU59202.1 MerR HTH family regulatory protein [Parafrankia irregularis]